MADEINILKASNSARDKELIKKLGDDSIDVAISALDSATEVPYIGSLIKIVKSFSNFRDYFFMKKLAKFMCVTDELSHDEIEKFLDSLSHKDSSRISSFLLHVLSHAEEDDKAIALGKIYKARVLGQIDNNELLKMSSIINRCYFGDLKHLEIFSEENGDDGDMAGIFFSLGLLEDCGNVYNGNEDGFVSQGWGSTKYKLNDFGVKFHQIISI